MKHLRHIAFTVAAVLFMSGLALFVSCKNKCGSTTCQNGGTCTDNVCVCPVGYSGNACQTAWSDKFVGTYSCTRGNCTPASTGPATWQSLITKNSTDGGESILISNFASANLTVTATVDSTGKMVFAPPVGSYGVSGSGTFINNVITADYTLSTASGAGEYRCSMTMTRE